MPSVFEPLSKENPNKDQALEILKQEGLSPIESEAGSNFVVCRDHTGNKFFLKTCSDTEKRITTKVLPSISERDWRFHALELPSFIKVITSGSLNFIFFPYVEGVGFNEDWNEISPHGNGGRAMKPKFAEKVVDLVQELSSIDVSSLKIFNLPTFNFVDWKNQNFPYISEILVERKIVTKEQIVAASIIFESFKPFINSNLIFTNGDFYPRNLIQKPDGHVVIVDWEGRQDYVEPNLVDQRNALINYPENLIAFFYIHMWGNREFQKKLLTIATERLGLTSEDLQVSILIKSLEQALIWPDDLARCQAKFFTSALNPSYLKNLLS